MDSTNLTSATSGQSTSFSAGILASITDAFGGDTAATKLFNSFLSTTGTLVTPPVNIAVPSSNSALYNQASTANKAMSSSTNTSSSSTASTTTSSTAANSTDDLTTAWKNLLEKLQERAKDKAGHKAHHVAAPTAASSGASSTDSTADSDDAASTTDAPQAVLTPVTTVSATTVAGATTTGTATSTDASQMDPTLANVLAELQQLADMIQQKLQAAQTAAGATAATPTTTQDNMLPAINSAATDPSTTAADASIASDQDPTTDALTEILKLIQMTEKKLDPSLTATAANTTTTSSANTKSIANATTSASVSATSDLQSFLAAAQAGGTSQAATSNANAGADTNDTATTANAALQTTMPDAALHGEATKSLAASVGAFFDALKNNFTTTTASTTNASGAVTAAPVSAASVLTSTGGGQDAAFSMDSNSGNTSQQTASNTATSTSNLNANVTADSAKSSSPYNFASQLSATRATSGTTGLPPAVEQVMLQLNRNVKSGNESMTIQLHPADLGTIKVKLDISSDGKVQGTVTASNPATLDMLQKDSRSLERSLQEAGLSADSGSLQFNLGGQAGQSQDQSANGSSSGSKDGTTDASTLSTDGTADTSEIYYLSPTRVNMKV